ncbi:MAG: AMP-binding protein [Pseudomonadota bacterium]
MTNLTPFPGEARYPPGIAWDAPIATTSLGEHLAAAVARHPDRVALIYRDARLTYAALGAMVRRAASALLVMPQARGGVGLLLPNSPWHSVAFFGAASAGVRLMQMSPLDAERELAHKLADSGARVLVTLAEDGLLRRARALMARGLVDRLVVADDAHWGGPAGAGVPEDATNFAALLDAAVPGELPVVDKHSVALLQYTGGTTGLPKGAMLTHANLTAAANIQSYWRGGPEPGGERVIHVLPLFHIFALTSLNRHLGMGNTVLMRQRFEVAQCLDDIEQFRATTIAGVPTMWIAMANHPSIETRDLSSLRYPSSGGAPLPVEVEARFARITGTRLRGGWGMTETAPAGTGHPARGESKMGSIGLPLPNVEMQVVALDDPHRVLPPGETGEFRIRGPNVMAGYWNKPEENAAAFADGFFLTGDVGHMDADGFFFLTDRKKDMILSGGFNVYPRVIEEAIYEHPDVAECVVIGVKDDYRGQSAKAFVVLRPGAAALSLEALCGFLAERVGRHEMPVALECRDNLPRTAVGKLSKLMLMEEAAAASNAKGET